MRSRRSNRSSAESRAAGSTRPARQARPAKARAKAREIPGQGGQSVGRGTGAPSRSARPGRAAQAKNAEASTRDRMVDIGRGNQQAGPPGREVSGGVGIARSRSMESGSGGKVVVVFGAARGIGAAIARPSRPSPPASRPSTATRASSSWPPDLSRRRCRSSIVTDVAAGRLRGGRREVAQRIRPVRPRRLRRRSRLGQVRLPVLEARAGRLGARAQGQPDRRGQRRTCVRPGDGRGRPMPDDADGAAARARCSFSPRSPARSARRPIRPTAPPRPRLINFAQCAAKDLAPLRRAGQHALPRHGPDPAQPRRSTKPGPGSSPNPSGPTYEDMVRRQDQEARPLEPLAAARGHRRHGRLPRLEPRAGTSPARRSTSTAAM